MPECHMVCGLAPSTCKVAEIHNSLGSPSYSKKAFYYLNLIQEKDISEKGTLTMLLQEKKIQYGLVNWYTWSVCKFNATTIWPITINSGFILLFLKFSWNNKCFQVKVKIWEQRMCFRTSAIEECGIPSDQTRSNLLFFGTLHSDVCIFPFLLCFSLLFFYFIFNCPNCNIFVSEKDH